VFELIDNIVGMVISLNARLSGGGKKPNIDTAKFAKSAKCSSNIFANFARFAVRFTPTGMWTLALVQMADVGKIPTFASNPCHTHLI